MTQDVFSKKESSKTYFNRLISPVGWLKSLFFILCISLFFSDFALESLKIPGLPAAEGGSAGFNNVYALLLFIVTSLTLLQMIVTQKIRFPLNNGYLAVYALVLVYFLSVFMSYLAPHQDVYGKNIWIHAILYFCHRFLWLTLIILPAFFIRTREEFITTIRKFVVVLSIIYIIFAFIQLACYYTHLDFLTTILNFFRSTQGNLYLEDSLPAINFPRLYLISQEPSHLAAQLINLWPMGVTLYLAERDESILKNRKRKRYLWVPLVLIAFSIFTFSPTFYFSLLFQLMAFYFFLMRPILKRRSKIQLKKKLNKPILLVTIFSVFAMVIAIAFIFSAPLEFLFKRVGSFFSLNDMENVDGSGFVRIIGLWSALKSFSYSPFLGIGPGNNLFYLTETINSVFQGFDLSLSFVNEIYNTLIHGNRGIQIPNAFLIILAETGLVGALCFLYLILYISFKMRSAVKLMDQGFLRKDYYLYLVGLYIGLFVVVGGIGRLENFYLTLGFILVGVHFGNISQLNTGSDENKFV